MVFLCLFLRHHFNHRETSSGIAKCQLFSQLKEITKEGIKIKRIINKTANFNPFTLRPRYVEMICRQILWCYHSNKPLWQNFSIVLLLWILLKEFPIFVNYLIWPLLELFMKLKQMLLKMPNHKTESKINLPRPLTTHLTRPCWTPLSILL